MKLPAAASIGASLSLFWRAMSCLTAADGIARATLDLMPKDTAGAVRLGVSKVLDNMSLASNGLRDMMASAMGTVFGTAGMPVAALPFPPNIEDRLNAVSPRFVVLTDLIPEADTCVESPGSVMRYEVAVWWPGGRDGVKTHTTLAEAYQDIFSRLEVTRAV
jgi:hypothetical protein